MREYVQDIWKMHRDKLLLGICMLISLLVLSGVLMGDREVNLESLERPSISAGSTFQNLIVLREDGSRKKIRMDISTRRYTKDEAETIFAEVSKRLPERIRGKNVSLLEVDTDLNLPEQMEEFGVDLSWKSNLPEMISGTGKIQKERQLTNPMQVKLEVTMKLQSHRHSEEIWVTVLPVKAPSWEERLMQELAQLESDTKDTEKLVLPEEFEGEKIVFVQKTDLSQQIGIALLPMMVGLLFYMKGGRKNEQQRRKRQEEIMTDYPELVVKMTVLYQAGMSMRNVWERIATDEKRKGTSLRPIYEEVAFACNRMTDGVSEAEAYRQFGKRCETAGCMKLGNLLAGNVRRGTRQLATMMAEESTRAWEQRKHLARRSGEKAGTKMLLPMFMMFAVVLAIVVVPAFYGFM